MVFPAIAQLEYEELETAETSSLTVHQSFEWDFDEGDFKLLDGKLIPASGTDYLRVWIQKALRTVRDSLIYSDELYGSEHHTLIGRNFKPEFMQAEFERMIREAILENDAVSNVDGFSFSQSGARLEISFTVESIYGTANEAVTI